MKNRPVQKIYLIIGLILAIFSINTISLTISNNICDDPTFKTDIRTSSIPSILWNYIWGGNGNDYGCGVAIDSFGNPYVTGYTTSYGAVNNDIFLVKFDLSGDSPLNIESFPLILVISIMIGAIVIVAINMRGFYFKRGKNK